MQAVSSDGKLLDSCLAMLVANFVPPLSFQKLLHMPRGVTRKDQVLNHVHRALIQISELVPLAPARLLAIIIQRMPIILKSEHVCNSLCYTNLFCSIARIDFFYFCFLYL